MKREEITLIGHSINFGFDTKKLIVKTSGDTNNDYRSECDGKSWIARDDFLPHMRQQLWKLRWKTETFSLIFVRFYHALWKNWDVKLLRKTPMLTFGTILSNVRSQFFKLSKLIWWNKEKVLRYQWNRLQL